jgi:hypothetical protein
MPHIIVKLATGRSEEQSSRGTGTPCVDLALPLDQVAEGYRAMDERRAIRVLRP